MSIRTESTLKSIIRRQVLITDGDYTFHKEYVEIPKIPLDEFPIMRDKQGKKKSKLIFEPGHKIHVTGPRLVCVVYDPYFYEAGIVSAPHWLAATDEPTKLKMRMRLDWHYEEVNPEKFNYFCRLYVLD